MNCIQPIAPAELGPMFRPKLRLDLVDRGEHVPRHAVRLRRRSARAAAAGRRKAAPAAAGGVVQAGARTRSPPFATSRAREQRRPLDDREGRAVAARAPRSPPAAADQQAGARMALHRVPGWTRRSSAGRLGRLLGGLALLVGPLLPRPVERDEEVVPVPGGVRGSLACRPTSARTIVDQRLGECLHLEVRAVGDRVARSRRPCSPGSARRCGRC